MLWDEEDKRGWLVNGISALLHLLRASLEHKGTDKFKSAFLYRRGEFQKASEQHRANSAIEALLNSENKSLKIYPEKNDYIRFEDQVDHFYDILEKIIDHQVDVAGQNGVKLKFRTRKHLEGWDFKDLVTDQDPLYSRVATLQAMGKGWVDFTRAINAITLFGRGFGEVIQPADNSDSCPHWAKLPIGKCYLAACVSDLKEIMDVDGDQKANPMKLSDNMIWYNPDKIFESCQCNEKIQRKHCDRVQVLLPSMLRSILPKVNPVRLEDRGAVVFGQNMSYRWLFPDVGDPKQEELPLLSGVLDAQSSDSIIESSQGTPTTKGSTDLMGTESLEPPREKASNGSLPDPSESESTKLNDNRRQIASKTEGHENCDSANAQRGRRLKRPTQLLWNMFRKREVRRSKQIK